MSRPTPRLLLLSNGHGEDLSGALLAAALQRHDVALEALPLVGHGEAYRRAGVAVLGPTREFSTGGLGYTSISGRLREIGQGQALYLLGRLRRLWQRRRRYTLVVAIGDLVPVLAGWLCGRPTVLYLVAYSSHYEGRLRLPWPCGWLLRSGPFQRIWSRDALTASDLSQQLGRPVQFLGNPFLDPVAIDSGSKPRQTSEPVAAGGPEPGLRLPDREGPADRLDPPPRLRLALLPGSRLPEARANLGLILQVLARLPAPWDTAAALRLQAALVRDLDQATVLELARELGWRREACPARGDDGLDDGRDGRGDDGSADGLILRRGPLRLELLWGRFNRILATADLVLAMAGTATEQAVGLGRPVVQLAGPGPQFTAGFAEAQRRLLGDGVTCAAGSWGSETSLAGSARLLARQLQRLADPLQAATWGRDLAAIGRERIGVPGGSERMAQAILALLRDGPGAAEAGAGAAARR